MRWIRWAAVGGVAWTALVRGEVPPAGRVRAEEGARCPSVVVTGEVKAGQEFRKEVLRGVMVRLEPLPAGWVVRVQPAGGVHGGEDWAEMATPPYRSVSPLLVSTDFAFRAQDAVGWNPRRFRFAANERAFEMLRADRQLMEGGGSNGREAEMRLAKEASVQPSGRIDVLDAHLVPGTADQTRAAGMVATHFAGTAHTIEQPGDGRASALGRLTWMRFRIAMEVPQGMRAVAGMTTVQGAACRP